MHSQIIRYCEKEQVDFIINTLSSLQMKVRYLRFQFVLRLHL
jgi:hypothetical protein